MGHQLVQVCPGLDLGNPSVLDTLGWLVLLLKGTSLGSTVSLCSVVFSLHQYSIVSYLHYQNGSRAHI